MLGAGLDSLAGLWKKKKKPNGGGTNNWRQQKPVQWNLNFNCTIYPYPVWLYHDHTYVVNVIKLFSSEFYSQQIIDRKLKIITNVWEEECFC